MPEWVRYFLVALASAALGALIALLRETIASLLRQASKSLASLLSQNWADHRFERQYLKWLAGECEKVSLIGVFPATPGREPRLSEIFVVPALSERRERRRPPREFFAALTGESEPRLPLPEELAREESRPVPLREALDRRTIAVLGEPGAGKSTLLRYLALAFAQKCLGNPSLLESLGVQAGERLPVLLPLRECVAAGCSLTDFAEEYVRRQTRDVLNPPPGYFERQVRRGRCLFLLDGLDEVLGLGDAAYRGICDAVNALAAVEEKNRFIVTSRIAGWRRMLSPDFAVLTIEPFDQPRREEFIRKWYNAVEASAAGQETPEEAEIRQRRARERADDLAQAVEESDRLRRLAENPLLLSVMAMVHRVDVTLPRERAALYRRCTELLLERWDVGRGVEDRGATGLTLAQKELLMRHIGYHFHERGTRFLPRREVEALIAGVLPSLGQSAERAGELLDWVERRTGLLADGEYLTFAHLAFQEYFAAGAILSDERLRKRLLEPDHLFDPWWREVVLLCAGMADDATEFIRRIYSPQEDDLLRRRLFLAGHCVGEAARVEEGLRREIRDELLRIWREGYDRQREEALRALSLRPDRETVDFFLQALKDEDAWVRWNAAWALGQLGVAEERVIQALLAALKDENDLVRWRAAAALEQLEVAEERVIQALLAALKDENDLVRWRAAAALERLGMAEERVIQALLTALKDENAEERANAAEALGQLGVADERVIQALLTALKNEDAEVQWIAAKALGQLGVTEERIIQALLAALKNEDARVRANAAGALELLSVADERVIQALLTALKDENAEVRENAAVTLGQLGVAEEQAIQALLTALEDENAEVRANAAAALGLLRVAGEEVIQALLAALKDENEWVRDRAFGALWEISERAGVWVDREGITKVLRQAPV